MRTIRLIGLLATLVLGAPAEDDTPDDGKGEIWAVLVAGSKGYDNYRHQANVCHAYQILHRHGVPDSNIIVMMYDDIADSSKNPTPGVIINKPNGPNVYGPKEVPKDYTGDAVTPENFINVLTGNKAAMNGSGSGKVLESGPNDHVFINFVDHGGHGLIQFPNGEIYADDLIKTLTTMNKKNMYKKLVFYLDACSSGSMFNKILPNNIGIFATTSAKPDEHSYACYWDNTVQTFVGGEYGISWMEDVDSEEYQKNQKTETLLRQFKRVVKRVTQSHPSMYGEKKLKKDHVVDYIGGSKKKVTYSSEYKSTLERFTDSVSSRDVALRTLERKIQLTNDIGEREKLEMMKEELVKGRKEVDELFERILNQVTDKEDKKMMIESRPSLSLEAMPCYRTLVDNFSKTCVNINKNTYAMGHLYKLANLCVIQYTSTDKVLDAYSAECTDQHRTLVGVN